MLKTQNPGKILYEDEFLALVEIVAGGLFQIDVFARYQRDQRMRQMQMIGRADQHGVDVFASERFLDRDDFVWFDLELVARAAALHVVHIGDAAKLGAASREKRIHHFAPTTPAANQRHPEPVVRAENAIVRSGGDRRRARTR